MPVSGVENAAYYYSTYNAPDTVPVSDRRKIMVLGGGPNRIGQGIEFDYCCVHAAFALREAGFESIMVNCNPETVSTDYDTSDKLYFEPLTVEDVLAIYEKERPEGVIVQFGGQTPLNLARELEKAGVPIIGTSPDTIDLAEDRDRFREMMERLGIPMPEAGMATTLEEAREVAGRIGYPLILRPSYVLGGRGMEIVHDEEMLTRYMAAAVGRHPGAAHPDRQVPRERSGVRGRRPGRRHRRLRTGRHGAHRIRGGALGRLGLRDPSRLHPREAPGHYPRVHQEDRHRAGRGGAHEHAVRDLGRCGLRTGGEPSGLAHGTAGVESLQRADGRPGHPT